MESVVGVGEGGGSSATNEMKRNKREKQQQRKATRYVGREKMIVANVAAFRDSFSLAKGWGEGELLMRRTNGK